MKITVPSRMEAKQRAEEHGPHPCALCEEFLEYRAQEKRAWRDSLDEWERRRCPDCGFLFERHAPDCEEEAGESWS